MEISFHCWRKKYLEHFQKRSYYFFLAYASKVTLCKLNYHTIPFPCNWNMFFSSIMFMSNMKILLSRNIITVWIMRVKWIIYYLMSVINDTIMLIWENKSFQKLSLCKTYFDRYASLVFLLYCCKFTSRNWLVFHKFSIWMKFLILLLNNVDVKYEHMYF